MAGRIDKVTKARLEAAGQWKAFQKKRDVLKSEGYSPGAARSMAISEAMPKCSDHGDRHAQDSGNALPVAPECLAGRSCSEPEIIRYVARNIDNPNPDPEDCPDPFAWTLLRQCRDNSAFQLFFVEKLWAKLLPSRAQQEKDNGDGKLDGTPTLKLVERIRSIRDKAIRDKANEVAER